MPRDPRMLLEDMRLALDAVEAFTQGRSEADLHEDAMLRAAVERQFIIVGEALAQLAHHAPEHAAQIHESRKVIAFRNVLVHGYDIVDASVVWTIVEDHAWHLRDEVTALLRSLDLDA